MSDVVEAEATSTTEADTTSASGKAAVPATPQVVAPKAEAKPAAPEQQVEGKAKEPAKPDEAKATGEKPAESKPEKVVEIVFKDDKGEPIKGNVIEAFTAMAKERGWTQDVAEQELGRLSQSLRDAKTAMDAAWVAELKADKELGGSKLDESLGAVKQAIEKVAGPEYLKALVDAGLGNHPPTVRAWAKVAKAISPDKFTAGVKTARRPGDLPNPDDTSVASFAESFFPKPAPPQQ